MRSISIHIIANQSSYHDDKSTLQCFICVFCPQLIRNVRSRRRIDSSSIIAHPVNSDAHLGEIVKMLSQELDIYIYIALDNRYGFFYQFNLGFSQFLFMKSLKFFFFNFLKLAGLWLVGEVVAIYGSKVAEGFSAFQRRSCIYKLCNALWTILMPYSIKEKSHHWFKIVACFVSRHHLIQCWIIVSWTLVKKLKGKGNPAFICRTIEYIHQWYMVVIHASFIYQ